MDAANIKVIASMHSHGSSIPLLRYIGSWERQENLWVPLAFTTIHNGVI